LRLFGVACCRHVWRSLRDPDSRKAVEVSERFADGEATPAALRGALKAATTAAEDAEFEATNSMSSSRWAARDAAEAAVEVARKQLRPGAVARKVRAALIAVGAMPKDQPALLRDILGNPFRPVAFNAKWGTDTAVALAKQMYESRDFGAMPILADALQEAGCEESAILDHCRGATTPHARGCWVVDLVLGKS
jgi:hypothetical protein